LSVAHVALHECARLLRSLDVDGEFGYRHEDTPIIVLIPSHSAALSWSVGEEGIVDIRDPISFGSGHLRFWPLSLWLYPLPKFCRGRLCHCGRSFLLGEF